MNGDNDGGIDSIASLASCHLDHTINRQAMTRCAPECYETLGPLILIIRRVNVR
jgi:hypothetical protein